MFLSFEQLRYALERDEYVNELLRDKTSLVIPQINHQLGTIGLIDLSRLDVKMRDVLMKWLLGVNRLRLQQGLPPMITFDLVKRCPIWQFINIPYKDVALTKEALNAPKRPRGFMNRTSSKRNMR
jgi:hypothetical protein